MIGYGYNREGYNRLGYDKEGYDREGYNRKGYNREGYDREEYDKKGYNREGYDREGYDENGWDKKGYNRKGFNREGIHKETKTNYDTNGYDRDGYNQDGYNREGYDKKGYNKDGYNRNGYDRNGYNQDGYDRRGYDKNGFDRDGFYLQTGKKYDEKGYDKYGYDKKDFNREGIHKETMTKYDRDGYDIEGYDKDGYNRKGLDRRGKTKEEKIQGEEERRKNWIGLMLLAQKLGTGRITLEEYVMRAKTSIDDLIVFAKKSHMSADVIRGLFQHKTAYKAYKRPFCKKEYLETTRIEINGVEIKPTEEDVDLCVNYLKENHRWICDKTVRMTILKYKKGELDITKRDEEVIDEAVETELEILETEQKELQETLAKATKLEQEIEQKKQNDQIACK